MDLLSKLEDTRQEVMAPVLYIMVPKVHDLNADDIQSIFLAPSTSIHISHVDLEQIMQYSIMATGLSWLGISSLCVVPNCLDTLYKDRLWYLVPSVFLIHEYTSTLFIPAGPRQVNDE
jgi:hypothetical protein